MFSLKKFFIAVVGVYLAVAMDRAAMKDAIEAGVSKAKAIEASKDAIAAKDVKKGKKEAGKMAEAEAAIATVEPLMEQCRAIQGFPEWADKQKVKDLKPETMAKRAKKIAEKFKEQVDGKKEMTMEDCKKLVKMVKGDSSSSCVMIIVAILAVVLVLGVVAFMMFKGKKDEANESSEDSQN